MSKSESVNLRGDVLSDLVQIFVRPLVPRHLAVCQVALRVAQPRNQPVRIDLAADLGQFRTDVAADQLRLAAARHGQRMTSRAKHLAETNLALVGQIRLFARARTRRAGQNDRVRWAWRCCALKYAGKAAQFLIGQVELRHARQGILGVVAVYDGIAIAVGDRAGFLQPLIDPLPADLCADVGQVGPDHVRAFHILQPVAARAIELRHELAAAIELRRFRQIGAMARAARSLNEMHGQERLLPCERGFMRLGHFGRRPLAAMAHDAAPFRARGAGSADARGTAAARTGRASWVAVIP